MSEKTRKTHPEFSGAILIAPTDLETLNTYEEEHPRTKLTRLDILGVWRKSLPTLSQDFLLEAMGVLPLSSTALRLIYSRLPPSPSSPLLAALASLPNQPKKKEAKSFFGSKKILILGYGKSVKPLLDLALAGHAYAWGSEEFGFMPGANVAPLAELYENLSPEEIRELSFPSMEEYQAMQCGEN